jgi:hypothetical protein
VPLACLFRKEGSVPLVTIAVVGKVIFGFLLALVLFGVLIGLAMGRRK